jgi:hypothetical protein
VGALGEVEQVVFYRVAIDITDPSRVPDSHQILTKRPANLEV